jgi:phenylpyruvate tautomerase PptA (4-oxalocrotonate tautomerase family)
MTRAAAEHYRRDNERIVRVAIQEIRPNNRHEPRPTE